MMMNRCVMNSSSITLTPHTAPDPKLKLPVLSVFLRTPRDLTLHLAPSFNSREDRPGLTLFLIPDSLMGLDQEIDIIL